MMMDRLDMGRAGGPLIAGPNGLTLAAGPVEQGDPRKGVGTKAGKGEVLWAQDPGIRFAKPRLRTYPPTPCLSWLARVVVATLSAGAWSRESRNFFPSLLDFLNTLVLDVKLRAGPRLKGACEGSISDSEV